MTNLTNFIPISRKLFKHAFWLERRTYSRFEAWLDMIAMARFEHHQMQALINNQMVVYGRGELAASLRFLGTRWGWSVTKVKTFLNLLSAQQMIAIKTAVSTNQTIISICNYDIYNAGNQKPEHDVEQQKNIAVTAQKQRNNKTNNVNKANKVNTDNSNMYRAFGHLSLSHADLENLKTAGYTKQQIDDVLDAIENHKNNKNYTSLYLTAKNWLSRPQVALPRQPTAKPPGGRINTIAGAFEQALRRE